MTLPSKLHTSNWDELDELLQVERKVDEHDKLFVTLPVHLEKSPSKTSHSEVDCDNQSDKHCDETDNIPSSIELKDNINPVRSCDTPESQDSLTTESYLTPVSKSRSESPLSLVSTESCASTSNPQMKNYVLSQTNLINHAIEKCKLDIQVQPYVSPRQSIISDSDISPRVTLRKRIGLRNSLKRRCSINGHYYNRETSRFVPPYGSATNVRISSVLTGPEVITQLLNKYKVESKPKDFSLFIVWDNGGKFFQI